VAAVEPEPKPEPKPESRDASKETARQHTPAHTDARAADKPADGRNGAQERPEEANSTPVPAGGVKETGAETPAPKAGDSLAATDPQTRTDADTASAAPVAQPMVQPVIAPVTAMLAAAPATPSAGNEQTAPDILSAMSASDPSEPAAGIAQPGEAADEAVAPTAATQNLPAMPAQAVMADAAQQVPSSATPVEQPVATPLQAAAVEPAAVAAARVQAAPAQTGSSTQIAGVQAGETTEQSQTGVDATAQAAPAESGAPTPDAQEQAGDPGKADNVAVDAAKPEQTARLEASHAETAQPKPAPQAAPPATTNMAIHGAATAQPQSAAPAAAITQHVEVGAEAAKPNVATLAVEISARSQSGARQFDIRLDPPELGRVEVRLSIDAAGKASAHLTAEQPQTLDLLQKDASVLTRALRDAGLDVSQNNLNFSLRHQNQDGSAHHGHARGTQRGMSLTATQAIEATPASASWRGDGRLDIRV
jgi:flagellar hook-length control protein FliK